MAGQMQERWMANDGPGGVEEASFTWDVAVIGTGRIGLPLALSFIEAGLDVCGVDRDSELRRAINAGRMPFDEPGYDTLIASRKLQVQGDAEVVAHARAIVVTVGTPLLPHLETDLRQVRAVLEGVRPHLRTGQLLALRSTVAPRTTAYVRAWIERHTALRVGVDFFLAYCPERIAEGHAKAELATLPQVIGADDPASLEVAEAVFGLIAPEVLATDSINAELVKLATNAERYVHFALANQLAIVADTLGANVHVVRRLANHGYPRNHLAAPGLTAGPCLRKDFAMVAEWIPYPDMLLAAWKVNESMPAFLVQHAKQRAPITDRVVAVLGFTFKAGSDDPRDSLVPKLVRFLERELPSALHVSDSNLPDPIVDAELGMVDNCDALDAALAADFVFVAMPHAEYAAVLAEVAAERPATWMVDLWNVGRTDRIFYQARDILPEGAV
jgi:UDP-N-acetyl-D-mannosaminuronic acid dehydrogenase